MISNSGIAITNLFLEFFYPLAAPEFIWKPTIYLILFRIILNNLHCSSAGLSFATLFIISLNKNEATPITKTSYDLNSLFDAYHKPGYRYRYR